MAGDPTQSRTGSHPAITVERPSPPPPPKRLTEEWGKWVEQRITALERDLGWPPVPAKDDPGFGMWRSIEDTRGLCKAILARLDAADASSATWTSRGAKVGWEVARLLIAAAVVAGIAWLTRHWQW